MTLSDVVGADGSVAWVGLVVVVLALVVALRALQRERRQIRAVGERHLRESAGLVTVSIRPSATRMWTALIENHSYLDMTDVVLFDEQTGERLPDVAAITIIPARDLDHVYFEHDNGGRVRVALEFTLGNVRWWRSASGATRRL